MPSHSHGREAADASAGPAPAQEAANHDGPRVIAPPPVIYLGGLAVGFGLQGKLPGTAVPAAVRWPLGCGLLAAGGLLARSFFRAFAAAQTPVSPYRAPTRLVTTGPYRVTRNPGYLGMALVYAGIALTAEALWALIPLAVVVVVIDRGVIAREERYLTHAFGDEYLCYQRQVRRWI